VLVAVPALATADHHRHDRRAEHHLRRHDRRAEHHLRRHHRRHNHRARVRHEHFGGGSSAISSDHEDQGTAGTVASFIGGVLKITLNDGSTVTGAVTADTELRCEMPGEGMQTEDRGPGGGDNSGDNDGSGDDQSEDEQTCSAVTPGMVVRTAELRISSAGAVWQEVELISQ
jgi:hypothetical protein